MVGQLTAPDGKNAGGPTKKHKNITAVAILAQVLVQPLRCFLMLPPASNMATVADGVLIVLAKVSPVFAAIFVAVAAGASRQVVAAAASAVLRVEHGARDLAFVDDELQARVGG